MSLVKDPDGFYHPESEREIIALVQRAREQNRKIRVRGSGHSVAHAIYTDPLGELDNTVIKPGPADRIGTGKAIAPAPPPRGPNLNVLLDVIPGYRVLSRECRLIEVDAGMQLSTLLRKLSKCHGWMLVGTGGIAHQTVGGFTATASAGGSLQRSVNDSICGFSLIDGTGRRWEVNRGDPDFAAMVPNLGLLGVVTRVRLCCVEDYIVVGRQTTTNPADAPVKLLEAGDGGGCSLSEFLTKTPYARIEWWPQRGAERVIAWAAEWEPAPPEPPYEPVPFQLFRPNPPQLAQLVSGVIYTILGNLEDARRAVGELGEVLDRLSKDRALLDELLRILRELDEHVGPTLASVIDRALSPGVTEAADALALELPFIKKQIPKFFPKLLDWLVPRDTPGGAQCFNDHAWRGLPMDDVVDDVYMPVGFTEMWVPMRCVEAVMKLLHRHFGIGKDADEIDDRKAYERTGTFAIELYATKRNAFWLNPAYSNGVDEWADGAFRVNPYWYGRNADDPAAEFFPCLWQLLRDANIPYRLHWGKFLPRVEDDPGWVEHISGHYPCWEKFLDLRKERDPEGIFLNDYWRDHLGVIG